MKKKLTSLFALIEDEIPAQENYNPSGNSSDFDTDLNRGQIT